MWHALAHCPRQPPVGAATEVVAQHPDAAVRQLVQHPVRIALTDMAVRELTGEHIAAAVDKANALRRQKRSESARGFSIFRASPDAGTCVDTNPHDLSLSSGITATDCRTPMSALLAATILSVAPFDRAR